MTKSKSLGAKYTKLKKVINDYLEDKGVKDETDKVLVDELIFNIYLGDEAKADIQQRGILVNIRITGKPLMQTNQAVNIYSQASKNIQTICTKLGLTVQERTKLKLMTEPVDELQSILDFNSDDVTTVWRRDEAKK